MQSNRLDNCKYCGRLFVKENTDYCLDCYHEFESEFKRVSEFLNSEYNRYATLEMVSIQTNVAKSRIAEFIRDGRIYAEDFPNLGYPCRHCGKLIKRQLLCNDCFEQLSLDINKTLKRDKLLDEVEKGRKKRGIEPQYWRLKRNK